MRRALAQTLIDASGINAIAVPLMMTDVAATSAMARAALELVGVTW